jgi:hypothetical protein
MVAAAKESEPDFCLKLSDVLADGRLTDLQNFRGGSLGAGSKNLTKDL